MVGMKCFHCKKMQPENRYGVYPTYCEPCHIELFRGLRYVWTPDGDVMELNQTDWERMKAYWDAEGRKPRKVVLIGKDRIPPAHSKWWNVRYD